MKIYSEFESNYKKALSFSDIEDLHQTRIALRRLIILLDVLRFRIGDSKKLKKLSKVQISVKSIQKQLGKIRDLDVFIDKTKNSVKKKKRKTESIIFDKGMLHLLKRERKLTRYKVLSRLPLHYNKSFKKTWRRFLKDDLDWFVKNVNVKDKIQKLEGEFHHYYSRFRSNKNNLGLHHINTLKSLHQLRLVTKKLRHTYKFAGFSTMNQERRKIRMLKRLQKKLGELNDLRNNKNLLQKQMGITDKQHAERLSELIKRIDREMHQRSKIADRALASAIEFELLHL